MSIAYIAIGSNLGNREQNCLLAIQKISVLRETKTLKQSTLIETDPVGKTDQPKFINGVIKIKTKLSPQELLKSLLHIEKEMGRVRCEKWGPRIIDLDIIAYDELQLDEPGLTLPHPRAHEREFVVNALKELGFQLFS